MRAGWAHPRRGPSEERAARCLRGCSRCGCLLLGSGDAPGGRIGRARRGHHQRRRDVRRHLRYEINRAAPGETVTFDAGVNPILTGPILIESGITLDGRGSGQTTITGPANNRVFDVSSPIGSQTLTISDVMITGGHAPDATSAGGNGQFGGAIEQGGLDLVISRVEFVGNLAGDGGAGTIGRSGGGTGGPGGDGGGGGAIVSIGGTLAISDSSFRDNFAGSGGTGGSGGTNNFGTGGTGGQGGDGGVGGAIETTTSRPRSPTRPSAITRPGEAARAARAASVRRALTAGRAARGATVETLAASKPSTPPLPPYSTRP